LTKKGSGTLTLSGANTYTGGTFVNTGRVQLSGAGKLGAASGALILGGGTLDLNGTTQAVGNLDGSGGSIVNNNAANVTLTIGTGDGAGGNFQGIIANNDNGNTTVGTLGLTKVGTGTIALSGANTYTGPTKVTGGTLAISGSLGGTGSIEMAGGTLQFGASNVVNDLAVVEFGPAGQLSSAGFSEFAGTGDGMGVNGTGAGVGALVLSGDSSLDLGASGSSILWFSGVGTVAAGTVLTIENWSPNPAGADLGGGFDQLRFSSDPAALLAQISFTGYGGATEVFFANPGGASYYEVVATAIPEPASTSLLGAAGLLALGGYRERRRFRRPAKG
jgi:autotransporter-associated beta strand protein